MAVPTKATFTASKFTVSSTDATVDKTTYSLKTNIWTITTDAGDAFESGTGTVDAATGVVSYSNSNEMLPNTAYKIKVEYTSDGATPATSEVKSFTTGAAS